VAKKREEEEGIMTGMIERLPGWPTLPDLFGWVESGFPGTHVVPGLHGIRIEEHLAEGTYVLRAELPGIDPAKDVEITVTEGVLTLRAERSEETTQKHRTEFHYGTFARSVRLPAGAKGDEATAEYKDGVLTITVPVPETKTGTKTIQVRHV
jgi:HSP20 family molecular chaperone IbpA